MIAALLVFAGCYALWVLYLAIMTLKRAQAYAPLPVWALRFGYPVLAVGYLMDFLANALVLTVILLELPRELLVTARLSRHIKAGTGYRAAVAAWICSQLLDRFDPSGCHCK